MLTALQIIAARPEMSYLTRAATRSMIGAGIIPGDTLVIEMRDPEPGEIALVELHRQHCIARWLSPFCVIHEPTTELAVMLHTSQPIDALGTVVRRVRIADL